MCLTKVCDSLTRVQAQLALGCTFCEVLQGSHHLRWEMRQPEVELNRNHLQDYKQQKMTFGVGGVTILTCLHLNLWAKFWDWVLSPAVRLRTHSFLNSHMTWDPNSQREPRACGAWTCVVLSRCFLLMSPCSRVPSPRITMWKAPFINWHIEQVITRMPWAPCSSPQPPWCLWNVRGGLFPPCQG